MQISRNVIPIYRLLAVPEKYHNTPVTVMGFVTIEFEGDVVYAHKEDHEHGLDCNGLWLDDIPDQFRRQSKQLHLKYCFIRGIFDAKETGHRGLFSGAIKAIDRFSVWSDPAKSRMQEYREYRRRRQS